MTQPLQHPRQYNVTCDLIDGNIIKGFGEKPAFIDPKRSLTYSQLQSETKKLANVLNVLGIKRETRIAMLMFDTVDYPTVFFGAMRAGVIPVCLNTLLTPDQYRYMLSDSRVEALFVSAALLPVVAPILDALGSLQHIIIVDGDGDQTGENSDFARLMADAGDEYGVVDTNPDETAFWLYSSGSTGEPKGTRHVHSSLSYVAEFYGKGILEIKHEDVVFAAAKLFFAYGLGAGLGMAMSVGATVILLPGRPTPGSVLATLKQYNPTLFFGVPTLYGAMLADPECNPQNSSKKLRLCISAGEALPADIGQSWQQRMGVEVVDGIGSTEMLHIFLSNRPGEVRYGTSGREFEGYRLRLIDENGGDVETGEIGELLVAGGSAAEGYWNQRAKSRNTFAGNWTHTGDKYYRDEDDYYHYCGRTDDMFKVSGRWVSPFEVEQALVSHPSVLEAAVVSEEDKDGLIKPKAFVVLNASADEDGLFDILKTHVKSEIGAWKYPRTIEFIAELPKTATGKIQRFKLRG
jgi:4-hydroxybenzoate-CoA ligase